MITSYTKNKIRNNKGKILTVVKSLLHCHFLNDSDGKESKARILPNMQVEAKAGETQKN